MSRWPTIHQISQVLYRLVSETLEGVHRGELDDKLFSCWCSYETQILYSASNTNMPKDAITTVKRKLFSSLWNKKKNKIKREGLYQDYDKGGIHMTDVGLIKAMRLAWIRSGFEIYFYVQLPLGQPQDLVWLPIEYFGCPSSCPSLSQETNTGSQTVAFINLNKKMKYKYSELYSSILVKCFDQPVSHCCPLVLVL